MADIEMKDANKTGEEEKKEETKIEEPTDHFYGKSTLLLTKLSVYLLELKKSLVILEKAGKEKDFKTCASLTK